MTRIESIAGAIFSIDRTQILLVKRRDVPVWVLPGGGIDPGESPEDAIVREILEETGLRVKVLRICNTYLPINKLAHPTNLYECSILSGSPSPSSETKEARFFSLSSLPLMPPPYSEWIRDAFLATPPQVKYLTSLSYCHLLKHILLHPILVARFFLSRLGIPINSR